MRKIIYLYILASILFVSCELDRPSNELGGFWKLTTIDTLTTGGVCDYTDKQIFWSFQADLMQTSDKDTIKEIVYRYSMPNDSLVVYAPFISNRDSGDIKVENPDMLRVFGINSLEEHFKFDRKKSGKFVISNDFLRLTFRKF